MKKSNRKKAKEIRKQIAVVMGLSPNWMKNEEKVKEVQRLGNELRILEEKEQIVTKKAEMKSHGVRVRLTYRNGKVIEVPTITRAVEISKTSRETVHKAIRTGRQPKKGNGKGITFEEIITKN
ncbi:hypothetical protein [Enterococcus dispar]